MQVNEPNGTQTLVVRDLLAMRATGQRAAVTAIIRMVRDLKAAGRDSRNAIPLKGVALWELKTRSRGGEKGGARVYFFWRVDGIAVLCGAEEGDDDEASRHLLMEALRAYRDYTAKPHQEESGGAQ